MCHLAVFSRSNSDVFYKEKTASCALFVFAFFARGRFRCITRARFLGEERQDTASFVSLRGIVPSFSSPHKTSTKGCCANGKRTNELLYVCVCVYVCACVLVYENFFVCVRVCVWVLPSFPPLPSLSPLPHTPLPPTLPLASLRSSYSFPVISGTATKRSATSP